MFPIRIYKLKSAPKDFDASVETGPFTLVGIIVKNESHLAPTLSLLLLGNELPPKGSSDLIFYQLCLTVAHLKPCQLK